MPPSTLAHREVRAVRTIEQNREVVLIGDVCACGDHDARDDVALDVEAEDRLGTPRMASSGVVRELDSAGLAATADLDLRFDDDDAADLSPHPAFTSSGGVGDVRRRAPAPRTSRKGPEPGTRRDPRCFSLGGRTGLQRRGKRLDVEKTSTGASVLPGRDTPESDARAHRSSPPVCRTALPPHAGSLRCAGVRQRPGCGAITHTGTVDDRHDEARRLTRSRRASDEQLRAIPVVGRARRAAAARTPAGCRR